MTHAVSFRAGKADDVKQMEVDRKYSERVATWDETTIQTRTGFPTAYGWGSVSLMGALRSGIGVANASKSYTTDMSLLIADADRLIRYVYFYYPSICRLLIWIRQNKAIFALGKQYFINFYLKTCLNIHSNVL